MSYVQPAIHPDNKVEYGDHDRVEFVIVTDGPVYTGRIVGIASSHIIDHWIIQPDHKIPGWKYSCVSIPHPQIRREGSNQEFLCRHRFDR